MDKNNMENTQSIKFKKDVSIVAALCGLDVKVAEDALLAAANSFGKDRFDYANIARKLTNSSRKNE